MTAAPQYPELHELVKRLKPEQAEAVRAVVLQPVTRPSDAGETGEVLPRRLSFAVTMAAEPDFAQPVVVGGCQFSAGHSR